MIVRTGSTLRRVLMIAVSCAMAASVVASPSPADSAEDPAAEESPRWIAAWGAPLNTVAGSGEAPSEATVRNIARITLGGEAIRIRLSNALGDTPLVIGAATVASQVEEVLSPAVVPGTTRPLTFGGETSVEIPPGTDALYSDPVPFPVEAQQNLAVSLYLPEATNPFASAANWNTSHQTPDGTGNRTQEADGSSFTVTSGATYALTAVDVLTTQADGAVVGLGSSTLHGSSADRDGYNRVLDLLSVRINDEVPWGRQKGIVSAGIGGDTLLDGLDRLERDVLTQSGVTGVIVYDLNGIGSNIGGVALGRTADEIIAEYRTLIARAHERGVLVLCPTWPPSTVLLPGQPTQEREKLNTWIMNSDECDDVVDWDAVVRDEFLPFTFKPQYQSETIHANAAGHRAMADATPVLRWFTAQPSGHGG